MITAAGQLSAAVIDSPYSYTMTASFGKPPLQWSAVKGDLPSSMTLSSNGVLSGTPDTIQTQVFTVTQRH